VTNSGLLKGKRLLIVEDEFIIAQEIANFVRDRGGEVAAMTGHLDQALKAADDGLHGALHGALVDVQLGEVESYPVVEKLRGAGVPVILMTGYTTTNLREDMQDCPAVTKPFPQKKLEALVREVFCG